MLGVKELWFWNDQDFVPRKEAELQASYDLYPEKFHALWQEALACA